MASAVTVMTACSPPWAEDTAAAADTTAAAAPSRCTVPQVIGHRGTPEDENTLRGLQDAANAGVSGVEFDVWWTQDGVPVLSHDPTVDRTTTGHGPIAAMTASQVRALHTKRGEPVPTLTDALSFTVARHLTAMVELKPTPTPPQLDSLLSVIHATGAAPYVVVHSFNAEAVDAVRRAAPDLHTALTHEKTRITGKEAARYGTSLNVSRFLVTPSAVRDWHSAGLKVYTWTANWPPAWEKAKAAGVDAVLTDRVEPYKEWARTACQPTGTAAP